MVTMSLMPLVRDYLESAGFKILSQQSECVVADKLVFGQDRDTWVVWTVPPDQDPARYEPTLRASVATVRPNYPDAKAYVLSKSRSGFSKEFQQTLINQGVRWLVPIWFFDAAFKVEEAPKAASAIADIRSLNFLQKRVPQPYSARTSAGQSSDGPDLFEALAQELTEGQGPTVRVIVGRAGIGKSYLFRALFAQLYDKFLEAKSSHAARARPIPLMPEHLRGTLALRTELMVENFLHTDVASPVARETFEWLLVNGFATWLLDGLDELYAGDAYFFEYLSDLLTRKDSKAQIAIWCRDSLLTTSDAFGEFQDLCSDSAMLRIYHLSEWQRPSKRQFAWLGLEGRPPKTGEADTPHVAGYLREIERSPTLTSLSGLPFYCDLLVQLFRDGRLQDFRDDVAMLDHVIDQMIRRDIEKGLLDTRLLERRGLEDWLEQIALSYVEGRRYADIDRDEAMDYGRLVIREGADDKTQRHILISLLQFPLFRAGAESGRLNFTHDLIADILAARAYLRQLKDHAPDVGYRLSRVDLENPTLLRFMASKLGEEQEAAIVRALQQGALVGRAFAILLSLLMLARPERDLVKRAGVILEARDVSGLQFRRRDLSDLSLRNADLSGALFLDCELRKVRFEGAYLSRTRFEGENRLQGARFGTPSRVLSLFAGRKLLETPSQIDEWIAKVTGYAEPRREPCPTALQFQHLFGKFITPLGDPRRDDLGHRGLVAGKRWNGAAPTEQCVTEAAAPANAYLAGPDFRDRYRRAEGDKYAEMVRFVKDGSISDGIGRMIARLCRRRGCVHQLV